MTKKIILSIVIIAVIICLSIVCFQYIENEKNKPRTITSNNLRISHVYIGRYLDDNSKFPEGNSFSEIAKACEIENEVRLDFWGTPLKIEKISDKQFILYSFGPNKQDDNQAGDDVVCGVDGGIKHN